MKTKTIVNQTLGAAVVLLNAVLACAQVPTQTPAPKFERGSGTAPGVSGGGSGQLPAASGRAAKGTDLNACKFADAFPLTRGDAPFLRVQDSFRLYQPSYGWAKPGASLVCVFADRAIHVGDTITEEQGSLSVVEEDLRIRTVSSPDGQPDISVQTDYYLPVAGMEDRIEAEGRPIATVHALTWAKVGRMLAPESGPLRLTVYLYNSEDAARVLARGLKRFAKDTVCDAKELEGYLERLAADPALAAAFAKQAAAPASALKPARPNVAFTCPTARVMAAQPGTTTVALPSWNAKMSLHIGVAKAVRGGGAKGEPAGPERTPNNEDGSEQGGGK